MKTRFKMILSGILGGAVVATGVVVVAARFHWWNQSIQPASIAVTQSISTVPANVTIQESPSSSSAQQNGVCSTVEQMLQTPTTNLDTSGFVQYVYTKNGVQLPRTIAEQAQVGAVVTSPEQLEKGDLVFFNLGSSQSAVTFDGVYLGENQFAAVTTHGLLEMNLNDTYWISKFQYGRRVL